MKNILFPHRYIKSVLDLPPEPLIKSGIKAVIFDIDNTLAPFYEEKPSEEIVLFIKKLQEAGFKIALLSNNHKQRVNKFNEDLGLPAFWWALKPLGTGLFLAKMKLQVKKSECLLVGDQVFTDVLCANIFGAIPVLVKPVSDRDEWITKIKRGIERKVIQKYRESRKKSSKN